MAAPEMIGKKPRRALKPDFASIFDAMPEPHLILSPDLIMVEANDARVRATGVARSDFVGRHLFDVFPDNPDDPAATGAANLRASLARVLRYRVPDAMALQRYDIAKAESEGGGFEERYWLPLNFPVLSDAGEVLWIVHRVEDVTEAIRREHAAEQAAAGQNSLIGKLRAANEALSAEVEERTRAKEALRQSEGWLRLLLDTAADGVYAVDPSGATILCNAAFCSMLGFRGEQDALGLHIHGLIHSTRPDGSFYPDDECPIYRAAQTGEPAHVFGESFKRLDGSSFPVEYWARPIIRDGELHGAVCTFIDVTERQRAHEQQELLLGELDHRVKNIFSIVSAIVGLSSRSASSVQEMSDDIQGRLKALVAAHELVRPSATAVSGSTTLRELVEKVLSPHASGEGLVVLEGAPVVLTSAQATGLALVLHELATNAVKYGSLSSASGTVKVAWQMEADSLSLHWTEAGGPAVVGPPAAQGFGTRLAKRTAAATLNGQVEFDWRSSGLAVHLSMPFPS